MPPSIETGQAPSLGPLQRRALKLAGALTTPADPSDYLALLDPRWSTREASATVERIRRETSRASTLVLRPQTPFPGHQPGQYLRLGVTIDGVRHWRAYSITSDPGHPLGLVSVTVQHVDGGLVSTQLVRHTEPGDRVYLGAVEGVFTLPARVTGPLLVISAGSGITPVLAMLRELERRGELGDVEHLHSARTSDDVIFGDLLTGIADRNPGYRLRLRHTTADGRLAPATIEQDVPDWQQRSTYACGPTAMLDAIERQWEAAGVADRLALEHYRPTVGEGDGDHGEGGAVTFRVSGFTAEAEPGVSILVAAERAGGQLPHGCRMGICRSCIGKLQVGQVRDLRTGQVHGEAGQAIRTCVNGPCGDIEIEL